MSPLTGLTGLTQSFVHTIKHEERELLFFPEILSPLTGLTGLTQSYSTYKYHRSQAEHLRKLRDGPGLIGALRGRETTGRATRKLQRRQTPGILDDAARTVRRKRRWAELESELLGMGMPRQTGGAFVTPLTMSVADRLE